MPPIGKKPLSDPQKAPTTAQQRVQVDSPGSAQQPVGATDPARAPQLADQAGSFGGEGSVTAADVETLKGRSGLKGAARPGLHQPSTAKARWVARVVDGSPRPRLEELGGKRTAPAPLGADVGAIVQINGVDDPVLGKVLARPGSARAEMYTIAEQHGLTPSFSKDVMAEVAAFQQRPGIDDPSLVDFTDEPFVTIDNDDSRDLDQAMCIKRRPGGGYDVLYALSDASYYCPPGSALFDEVLKRGASFYLPGLMVPMTPEELSTDLMSLNERADRRAMVFTISLNEEGEVVPGGVKVDRGRIHSRRKLAYNGVQQYHDAIGAGEARQDTKHHGHDFTETLTLLKEVGERRMRRASERGVVRHQRKAVNVKVGDYDHTSFELLADERNDVERWNEQISLLCNVEGAKLLKKLEQEQGVAHGVYRVHPHPSFGRLAKLAEYVDKVVDGQGLDDSFRFHPKKEGLADYLARLPTDGQHERVARAIHRQALLVNEAASYEPTPGAHHGVGTDEGYARFTAPMRELVGIYSHKELLELLGHQDHLPDDPDLQQKVVAKATEAAGMQRKLTKAANRFAIDAVFESQLRSDAADRPVHTGTILGLKHNRLYVELDDPPLEIKVYLDKLSAQGEASGTVADDQTAFETDDGRRFVVGDAIDLRLADAVDDRYLFALAPKGD
jgi:ribonuclease R